MALVSSTFQILYRVPEVLRVVASRVHGLGCCRHRSLCHRSAATQERAVVCFDLHLVSKPLVHPRHCCAALLRSGCLSLDE